MAVLCVSRNPYAKQEETNKKLEFLHGDQDRPISIKEAYTSVRFKKICIMFMFGTFYGLYMASSYKIAADEDYIDDEHLTIAGSLGAVCNGGSRLMWATLLDKYRFNHVYGIIMGIQLAISCTIYFTRQSPTLYIIWVCISYLCEGGQFSCFPVVIANVFGLTNGGVITTLAFLAVPISSISSFVLVLFEAPPLYIYIVGAVLTFANIILLYTFDDSEW